MSVLDLNVCLNYYGTGKELRLVYAMLKLLVSNLVIFNPGDSTEIDITVYRYVNQMHIFLLPFV